MSDEELNVAPRTVDDMLVAGIRFLGQFEEIPEYFGTLYEQVQPYINGKAFCLLHGRGPKEGHQLEVCYPVSQAVDEEEVASRMLQGGEMLTASHSGPYDSPRAVLGKVFVYLREHAIDLGDEPPRIVYLQDGDERRDSAETFVTELQLSLHLPRWLDELAEGLDRFAGEAVRQQVMDRSETLTLGCTPREKADWVKGAMERLDAAVADEETRSKIMTGCSHRYPEWRIQEMRAHYERLGNIDQLLTLMRLDQSDRGFSWYSYPERVGNLLYETKNPADPEKYLQATTEAERRAFSCYCGLVRAAILAGETISTTHCYCGAGWPKQLWEGILGRPVQVEIRRSVLRGDDCCSFTIHLPLEELPG